MLHAALFAVDRQDSISNLVQFERVHFGSILLFSLPPSLRIVEAIARNKKDVCSVDQEGLLQPYLLLYVTTSETYTGLNGRSQKSNCEKSLSFNKDLYLVTY